MSGSQSSTSNETFTLLLFASVQSYCDNKESLSLPAPMTLKQLFDELEQRWPGIGEKILRSSQVALNLDYVDCDWSEREKKGDEIVIKGGDEVGIVPPVSAG